MIYTTSEKNTCEDKTHKIMTNRDLRTFIASAAMLLTLVAIVCYLTFIPVPEGNDKAIMLLLGVLAGAGSSAIPNLFSTQDQKRDEKIKSLETQNALLAKEMEVVKSSYDSITKMLVDRHIIDKEGIKN